MARLTSLPSFTGTTGPVTVYRMFGQYYVRSRSSLTAKRVKTDPAFRTTMQYAALLSHAAKIGSKVYALMLPLNKKHTLYRKLTGEAMTWLKYGWKETDIIEYLTGQYRGLQLPVAAPVTKLRPSYSRPAQGVSYTGADTISVTCFRKIPFELRAWRRRDQLFRAACQQDITTAFKSQIQSPNFLT